MTARYLADKSALSRISHPEVASWLEARLLEGDVARCSIIDLEVLFSARSHRDLIEIRDERTAGFPLVETTQADFERAQSVMEALARTGKHRAVGIPDLLIAAVAERAGLVVVHYDADFDLIAGVTKQPMHWVVPKGRV
ncbi:MAG: PIN domain nuclease [Candidatus Dormibacteraeota bacterium]|nr:PIN domain nuclease [Candidatus Dormibacteraeota bacterium]